MYFCFNNPHLMRAGTWDKETPQRIHFLFRPAHNTCTHNVMMSAHVMLGSPVDPLVLRPDVPDDQPGVLQPAPAPAVVHEVPVRVPGVVAVMLPSPLHPVT